MQVTIREAEQQDLPELARMISADQAWRRYGIGFKEALKLLENADETMYLAEDDGKIKGFCALRINGVGNFGAYLRIIVVDEPFRSRGIGKMLMDYAFELTIHFTPNLF